MNLPRADVPPASSSAGPIRVLVVDDSAVIRGLITRLLESDPELAVVGSVGNGQMAIATCRRTSVDIVVLDIEMPVMDGLTALPQILAAAPGVKVIMASTLTTRNAQISLKALQAGAADYVAKPTSTAEIQQAQDFRRDLVGKVKALGQAGRKRRAERGETQAGDLPFRPAATTAKPERPTVALRAAAQRPPEIIAIGSSTGGPQALLAVLSKFPNSIRLPILITQHMPATFTSILAEHLARASGWPCAEAVDGEPVRANRIYVAPGDFHMKVAVENGAKLVRLTKEPPENFCRPAVDPMFRSVAQAYGAGVLGVVLTGMGTDGAKGARAVVDAGGSVIAQDEATSVVWGMPGAAAAAGVCSAVLPLSEISTYLRRVWGAVP
ncbi:MAG TPA: chemotaxis response regulator protein-glutamate methylesterase [Alphaproteobacteria bacterium]|nr:chemotaxis response regulator protein-glutamate methylesterase [Alphaproteobacteria bacterium]